MSKWLAQIRMTNQLADGHLCSDVMAIAKSIRWPMPTNVAIQIHRS
jgi:hypothetical protein